MPRSMAAVTAAVTAGVVTAGVVTAGVVTAGVTGTAAMIARPRLSTRKPQCR